MIETFKSSFIVLPIVLLIPVLLCLVFMSPSWLKIITLLININSFTLTLIDETYTPFLKVDHD